MKQDYLALNKASWNNKVEVHLQSDFYDMASFMKGETTLKDIELPILGEIDGKSILHLQCHFGQDSISLARMGAKVTGIDLSDKAIETARILSVKTGTSVQFVESDVYSLDKNLKGTFDIVFTSYGTISWLPDLDKWAKIIAQFLRPGGQFVFAEFHPVIWMYDDDFKEVYYSYFGGDPIIEEETGSYADRNSDIRQKYVCWNHSIEDVVMNLINNGMQIELLKEYDYAPYNFVNQMVEFEKGKFRIKKFGDKIPYVYAIKAIKK